MIEKIDKNVSLMIAGLKKARIDDIDSFLSKVSKKFPNIELYLINADFCVSPNHAKWLAIQYLEAKKRGLSYAKKVDLILRFALNLQIDRAIEKAGYKKGEDTIVIAIGDKKEIKEIKDIMRDYGKIDEKIVYADNKRINKLKKVHKISSLSLNSTIAESKIDKLSHILCERAATLGLKKY